MTERMQDRERVYEGTWEEVAGHGREFAGRRVRLTVLAGGLDGDVHADMTFREILVPVHKETAENGTTEDELTALFEEARQEVWEERHNNGRVPGSLRRRMSAPTAEGRTVAVYDCMVFLQAAASDQGASFACLELLETDVVELAVSEAALAEVPDVLSRPSVRRKMPRLTDTRVAALLERAERHATSWPDVPSRFPYARAPKNEKYLDLAVTESATYLVSRDNALLDLMQEVNPDVRRFKEQFPELAVLEPGAFLRALREAGQIL